MSDYRLSSREAEVAGLVAQGYTDKQIAAELGVTPRWVRRLVQRIATRWQLDGERDVRVQIARRMAA